MIPRRAERKVEEALGRQAAVALLGPRQVGKTTLATEIAERAGALYLDLEAREDRARLAEPALFLRAHEDRLVVLDEIHRVPELFQTLRGLIDQGRRRGRRHGRFLVLGSASMDLLRQSGVGSSWEGFVVENLLAAAPSRTTASFYRTSAGAEMDLVLDVPGRGRWAIEIKRGLEARLGKGFYSACEDLEPSRRFVVYSGDDRHPVGDAVEAIGLRELMEMLATT